MAEYDPKNFSKSPYFDDYDETKKFLRILFKPGRAVQARELTQLQSISQNQVTRFSNHFFKEGSQVFNGQLADIKCKFLRIEKQHDSSDINITNFKDSEIALLDGESLVEGAEVGDSSAGRAPQRAKVLHVEEATTDDPYHIFFIEYVDSVTGSTGEYTKGNTLTKISYDATGKVLNTQYRCTVKNDKTEESELWKNNIYTTGDAVLVSNDEGVFYVEGYFVLTGSQIKPLFKTARSLSTILETTLSNTDNGIEIENTAPAPALPSAGKYTSDMSNFVAYTDNEKLIGVRLFQYPTAKVGFSINRQAVESTEDVTLLDNAFGSYNYSAPGGDRYKIELTLAQIAFPNIVNDVKLADYVTDDFLEKMRVIDGSVSYLEKYPTYSDFEETLARRTYDESGNYTVRPFEAEVREYFRDDQYILTRSEPKNESNVRSDYSAGDKIVGTNTDGTLFYGLVVHDDLFLDREEERVDLSTEEGVVYGTTSIYLLNGKPKAGASLAISGSGSAKNSTIITDEILSSLTEERLLTDGSVYAVKYPPVQLVSDDRNGLYSLSRLAPSVDDMLTEVNTAKSKLAMGMGAGKAYIFGYEFENQSPEYIPFNKSRKTKATTDQEIVNGIGNFVVCDLVTGQSAPDADPTSHYYVELWGAADGWSLNDGGTPDDCADDYITRPTATERKGIARVRGVNYNFVVDDFFEETLAQVFLYDVEMELGKKFADVSELRLYGNTTPLFQINVDYGVEEISLGNCLSGGMTTLFDPKNNTSLFCIPTHQSTKSIENLDSYEVVKSFTDCYWKEQSGGSVHWYLTSDTIKSSGNERYLSLPDYGENVTQKWSGAGDTSSTFGQGWNLPFAVNDISNSIGSIFETRYALRNNVTGVLYDFTDSDNFVVGNNPEALDQLTIWAKDNDGVINVETGQNSYTLLAASVITANSTVDHIRTKTLKSVVGLRDVTSDPYGNIDYKNFFSTIESDGIEGYYKVTLKNAMIQDQLGAGSTGPNYAQSWHLWTQGAGSSLDFTDNSLPREYITDIGFSDVTEVTDILVWHTDGNGTEILKDITEEFEFEPNNSDNLHDHCQVVISRSQLQSLYSDGYFQKGQGSERLNCTLYIRFKYFEHSGAGPVIVNSYDHTNHHPSFNGFEDIPVHTSPIFGERMELRNCVDYRPLRTNVSSLTVAKAYDTTDPTLIDTLCPIRDNFDIGAEGTRDSDSMTSLLWPGSPMSDVQHRPQLDYTSYLARIDKIVLRKSREFDILAGESAVVPEAPDDDQEAMTLYSMAVPEYTYEADDILLTYIDHQRFTMEDIAKLEKRIEKIEYYTSLNLLEKETSELSITDGVAGGERFKNGILVDNFKGHGVGDVLHRDYNCAMDFETGELRPTFNSYQLTLGEPEGSDVNNVIKSPDDIVTLRYLGDGGGAPFGNVEPPRWLVQPVASRAISVNPFNVTNWLGSLKLSPSSDTWKDTKRKPTVKINLEGENDAWEAMGANASKTQWNDWSTTWSGTKIQSQSSSTTSTRKYLDRPHTRRAPDGRMRRRLATQNTTVTKTTSLTTKKQTRTGIRTTIVPERVTRKLGDKVVDVSIIPFIRTKVVTINATAMKPNTQVYPFFDDVDVSEHCSYAGVTGGVIVTDDSGKVTNLLFEIPAGKFKTGEREFRLTDSSSNNVKSATTSAEATYFAQGLLQTKQSTVVSTRVPTVRRQTVSDSRVVRDVVTRNKTTKSNASVKWVDPLAQTFLVDSQKEPDGVWVHSVDLFLARKPSSGVPITVQIRPTVNGYPHSSMVLPFAEAVVEQVDVNTTKALTEATIPNPDNSDTYTRFKFTSPVYLVPGEYALVVMSNSDEYECYIAEMGEERVGPSTERITQNPYAGVFFKSQNASTWSADQNVDLMFAINKCEFQGVEKTGGYNLTFKNQSIDDYDGSSIDVDTFRVLSENVEFEKSPLKLTLSGTQEPLIPNYEIPFNENINLSKSLNVSDSTKMELSVNIDTTSDGLSPVIDLDRFNLIAVDNIVEGGSEYLADESAPFAPRAGDAGARAGKRTRYITRRVELDDGIECDDFKVYLTGHRPVFQNEDGTLNKTHIRVWLKAQTKDDNRNFENLPWWEMPLKEGQDTIFSEEPDEFFEYEYMVPEEYLDVETGDSTTPTGFSRLNEMFDTPIARYAFKITLHTSNSTYLPKVKDFRTIAVT